MNIIFDLDGTLIDSSERMYRLFCELIPQSRLSKEQYWALKRDKVNHKMLLERYFPEVEYEDFNGKWMPLIEEERFLLMDKKFDDTIEVLTKLSNKADLFLLTARQSKEELLKEIARLGLAGFFKEIMVTEGKLLKEELLKKSCERFPELKNKQNFFVSDMGKDIQLGNTYGYQTVAITHGFMNEDRLKEYNPAYVINELIGLLGLFE